MNDLAKKLLSESPFGSDHNEPGSDFRGAGPSDRMRDDSHDIVDHPPRESNWSGTDLEREIEESLSGYESQLDEICGILFEIGGEIYSDVASPTGNDEEDLVAREKIVEAMVKFIRERVSSNASAL